MSEFGNILLVEDNALEVELILMALEPHNLASKVVAVPDGQEAMVYLNKEDRCAGQDIRKPDLILLDLKMPRMNGLETLKRVRSDERFKTIPVVMLTSSREEQDIIESYRLGVNAYVIKSPDINTLGDTLVKLFTLLTPPHTTPP